MSLEDMTAPLAEVAAALGKSEKWLKRNWLKFHIEQGFPRKVQGWRWPRMAVEAWITAQGVPLPLPSAENDNYSHEVEALVAAQSAALARRYGVAAL